MPPARCFGIVFRHIRQLLSTYSRLIDYTIVHAVGKDIRLIVNAEMRLVDSRRDYFAMRAASAVDALHRQLERRAGAASDENVGAYYVARNFQRQLVDCHISLPNWRLHLFCTTVHALAT